MKDRSEIAVISVPRGQLAVAALLPKGVRTTTLGVDRSYHLYLVHGGGLDEAFHDPFDGALLIECRFFDDEPAARRWISTDIELRALRTGGVQ